MSPGAGGAPSCRASPWDGRSPTSAIGTASIPKPLTARQALDFLTPLLDSELVTVLRPRARHCQLMQETIEKFGKPAGNIFHDLHTAILMREHGVSEIMTADTDFRKFTFLTVTDPVHGAP